jgi:threonyl-tRNA synthetase
MPEQAIIVFEWKIWNIWKKVLDLLENNEIRLLNNRNETIGKKIRDAEMQKSRLCWL